MPKLHYASNALPGESPAGERPFDLSRWFALLAAFSIGLVTLIVASLLTSLYSERMLTRDGQLTASFVDSISQVEPPGSLFETVHPADTGVPTPEFFEHVAAIEGAMRINAYNPQGVVVWSTDKPIIGSRFDENDELAEALTGRLVVHSGEASLHPKPEHFDLASPGGPFVEYYIPVRTPDRSSVIGVIEVYRVPALLFDSIETGRRLTWVGAGLAAAVLFIVLWSGVRRADRILLRQKEQLLEAQTLATVGELSRAVAHSVRNPLAAIRSSAELELHQPAASEAERTSSMREIIGLVDRVDDLLSDILSYSTPGAGEPPANVDVGHVVRRALDAFAQEFRRHRVDVRTDLPAVLPEVSGDERLLTQAFASVMSNAVEAMPEGGRIEVTGEVSEDRRSVRVAFRDTGVGMAPEQLARAFDPFYTNKARGLGIGLALVKRIIELSRGQITLSSDPGRGTTVLFTFQVAMGARA